MEWKDRIAREEVFNKKRPFLLELLSNRLGDHSTSDDSSAYRSKETLKEQFKFDGMIRMKKYLVNKKYCLVFKSRLWNDKMEEEINKKDFEELKKCLSNVYMYVYKLGLKCRTHTSWIIIWWCLFWINRSFKR